MCGASSSVSRNQQTLRLSAINYITVEKLMTLDGPAVVDAKDRYWSKIAIVAQLQRSRRNTAITFSIVQEAQLSQRGRAMLRVCL